MQSTRQNYALTILQTFLSCKKGLNDSKAESESVFGSLPMTHFYSLLEEQRKSQKATDCRTVWIVALKKTHQPLCHFVKRQFLPSKRAFMESQRGWSIMSSIHPLTFDFKSFLKNHQSPFGPQGTVDIITSPTSLFLSCLFTSLPMVDKVQNKKNQMGLNQSRLWVTLWLKWLKHSILDGWVTHIGSSVHQERKIKVKSFPALFWHSLH